MPDLKADLAVIKQRLRATAALGLVTAALPCGRALAQDDARSYTIETSQSAVYVITHRSGLLSFLGHDHALLATSWSGSFCWSPLTPARNHGHVEIAAAGLLIDTDSARSLAGLGSGPSPRQVQELQVKVLDSKHLDAAQFPSLALTINRAAEPAGGRTVAHGRLTIRDRVRDVEFPMAVSTSPDSVRFSGVLHVRQSAFGIRPESIAAVVKVADQVDIHFNVLGIPTGDACGG